MSGANAGALIAPTDVAILDEIDPGNTERLKWAIDEIARQIGQSAVDHLRMMYPAALDAVTKNARISLRNHVRNDINGRLRPLIMKLAEALLAERGNPPHA